MEAQREESSIGRVGYTHAHMHTEKREQCLNNACFHARASSRLTSTDPCTKIALSNCIGRFGELENLERQREKKGSELMAKKNVCCTN